MSPTRFSLAVATLMLALSVPAQAAVKGEEVLYKAGDTQLKGFIAHDDATADKRPGVLVVHEWWGHNDYARSRAEQLAALGYTALAVDMYGDGRQADHPADAGKFSGEVKKNLPVMRERFLAALERLKADPTVDPGRTAAIGYCFGGGVVLAMAREGADLDGAASFHGSLTTDTPAQKGQVKAHLFIANGTADPMTTPEHIAAFKAEMEAAGVPYELHNYEGAKHSFTNPDADALKQRFSQMPIGYDAAADKASWAALQSFLKGIF